MTIKIETKTTFKETHVQNGSMYLFKKILNKFSNRLGGKIEVFEMDEWQSLQLDDIKQLQTMELLFKKLKNFMFDINNYFETSSK